MATYITLINFTEQGIANIKEGPARLDAAKALAKAIGGELKAFYLTMGGVDAVAICELPDDAAAAKMSLTAARGGNIRTQTLRAFGEGEYREIIAGLD